MLQKQLESHKKQTKMNKFFFSPPQINKFEF